MARNDGSFQITKFAFGDDEIDYQLFDASASDPDADINNLPVLEPVSNESVALNYRLISLPQGSLKISKLTLSPSEATSDFGDTIRLSIKTENGEDSQGYSGVSRDTDIARLDSTKALPENGEAIFNISTGLNAGSKSGLVKVDITGVNTGARGTFALTVSASGTT